VISVIVCTYNRDSSLRSTLDSFAQMSVPESLQWELIVVDNNSQDETRKVVTEFAAASSLRVRYVFEPSQGKSRALNAGIRAAQGDLIAMTDDDVIVGQDWLSELNKAFGEFDCIGVGGKINALWPCPKPSWFSEEGPYRLPNAIVSFDQGEKPCVLRFAPLGANLAVRKIAFEKYGAFRTDLGPQEGSLIRGEDTEFFHRLRNRGERFVYMPTAVVNHPVEKSRVRKGYYRSWSFHDGRFRARFEKVPDGAIYYFGAPRYLYRGLVEKALRWICSFQPKKRFYYELRMWWLAGQIFEIRRQAKGN
jgi:glucosyl-dolichyl phosphate glucuronosyltransferase